MASGAELGRDVVALTQALVRCESVTPNEGGALDLVESVLTPAGFTCKRLRFEEVDNLFAYRLGTGAHLMFGGHTDVVPVGDINAWNHPPFAAEVADGWLYGRGAEDMKGNVAAALVAALSYLETSPEPASLSFLLTGDEEGPAKHGTRKLIPWLQEQGFKPQACINLEPTASDVPADTLKMGRRGSLSGTLQVLGSQGHVGYPHLADNPLPDLARLVLALSAPPLDEGTEHFQASNLEVTSIDVGNPTLNVIPGQASAKFNVRFNPSWNFETLKAELKERLDRVGRAYKLSWHESAEAFLSDPDRFAEPLADLVAQVTGQRPQLSTSGGTSDARFIKDLCPVVDMGLPGKTMHQVDERVAVADLHALSQTLTQLLPLLATHFASATSS